MQKTQFGYYRNDIRLHDSRQAGEIARRLGGESSFSPSHIPKSYDKGKLVPSKSKFLINRSSSILRCDSQPSDEPRTHKPELNRATQQVYRQPTYIYHSPAIPEVAHRQAARIIPNNAELQRIDETVFQVNQKVMREISGGKSELKHQASMEIQEFDPEKVAVKVYRLMCRDMVLERERGAFC